MQFDGGVPAPQCVHYVLIKEMIELVFLTKLILKNVVFIFRKVII